MILRDRCSTLYDLASLFSAGAVLETGQSSEVEKSQNALVPGHHLALNINCLRKSRRIVSLYMLSSLKMEDDSPNCFVDETRSNTETDR